MKQEKAIESFAQGFVFSTVLTNAIPAIAAMLMVIIYNLADTFFISLTDNDYMVAAVSLATPVFLIFMSVGTLFGFGGTSVISRAPMRKLTRSRMRARWQWQSSRRRRSRATPIWRR